LNTLNNNISSQITNLEGLHVLILVPALRRKGPVLGAIALAPELKKRGAEVTIGRLDPQIDLTNAELDRLREAGVRITEALGSGWLGLTKIRKIGKFVRSIGVDAVISYGIRPDIVNSMLPSRIARIGYVRNMIARDYEHRTKNRLLAKGFAAAHHMALRRLDGVMALSEGMKSYLVDAGIREDRTFKVMNFLDRSWTDTDSEPNIQPNGAPIHIGYFGGLSRLKRVHWMIQAVADAIHALEVDSEIVLDIVGEGPERQGLEDVASALGIAPYVRFHGSVDDVRPLMEQCTYVMLASESEGIPRAFMEAMSLGVTCIGPRIDGIVDLIDDGVNGYMYDSSSPANLSEIVVRLATNETTVDRQQLSDSSRKRFSALRSSEAVAEIINLSVGAK